MSFSKRSLFLVAFVAAASARPAPTGTATADFTVAAIPSVTSDSGSVQATTFVTCTTNTTTLDPESEPFSLKEEIHSCDSFACVVQTIVHQANLSVRGVLGHFKCHRLHHHRFQDYLPHWYFSGDQSPAAMESASPQVPADCLCRESAPKETYRATPTAVTDVEKATPTSTAPPTSSTQQPNPDWREAHSPSRTEVFWKALFTVTGLAFIFALFRRCCCCGRRRKSSHDSPPLSPRRSRRGRSICTEIPEPRYNEKRRLVTAQETVLEAAMQDEIHQLKVQEEIRQLRTTRNAVDDLIRAEEGRLHHPAIHGPHHTPHAPSPPPLFPSNISAFYPPLPHARAPSGPPGWIPYNPFEDPESDTGSLAEPPSPLSRTSSLPEYRSEASFGGAPPAYTSDRETLSDAGLTDDVMSDYSPSTAVTIESGWTPGSSIRRAEGVIGAGLGFVHVGEMEFEGGDEDEEMSFALEVGRRFSGEVGRTFV
ncbi:hypothetical protein EJ06DRAFT_581114 [Trichodelitschia bisporula]|uniref:Uncharacterized protein n=1 Tax=Trichodelitschia bisporula TaxID=703511 RepID=A0A6G1I1E9_9PEZI|nr:hypothetical protein EJ06DRAFT_581114 [Trichodelitschia bisporula]